MLVLTEQYHPHVLICSLLVTRAHVLRALAQAFEDFSSGTGKIFMKGDRNLLSSKRKQVSKSNPI